MAGAGPSSITDLSDITCILGKSHALISEDDYNKLTKAVTEGLNIEKILNEKFGYAQEDPYEIVTDSHQAIFNLIKAEIENTFRRSELVGWRIRYFISKFADLNGRR